VNRRQNVGIPELLARRHGSIDARSGRSLCRRGDALAIGGTLMGIRRFYVLSLRRTAIHPADPDLNLPMFQVFDAGLT